MRASLVIGHRCGSHTDRMGVKVKAKAMVAVISITTTMKGDLVMIPAGTTALAMVAMTTMMMMDLALPTVQTLMMITMDGVATEWLLELSKLTANLQPNLRGVEEPRRTSRSSWTLTLGTLFFFSPYQVYRV